MRKIFLACPYSHADENVVHERFVACNKVAAKIAESGNVVFSQVTMSHPINLVLEKQKRLTLAKCGLQLMPFSWMRWKS